MKRQVNILARELYLETQLFIWHWCPDERYLDFKTGALHIISISLEHSGLAWGAILRKLLGLTLFPRLPCSFFQEHVPMFLFFFTNVLGSMELLNMDRTVHIWTFYQVIKIVRSVVFPGSQVISKVRCSVFPGSQVIKMIRFFVFSISRFPCHQNDWCFNISRSPAI